MMIKNDLIKWMKVRALFNLKANIVAKFLWKNIICCFECFESTVINEDSENKIMIRKLLNKYRVKIKLISIYHSFFNEMIEKKHRLLINVLSKLIKKKLNDNFNIFMQYYELIVSSCATSLMSHFYNFYINMM